MSEFEEYVAARGGALLRFAYVLTGHQATAEDLTQSALADAFAHWSKVRRADHPDAYVRRILLNGYLGLRRRRSTSELPDSPALDRAQPAAVDDAERDVLGDDWFRHAIERLSPRGRAVIVLRYYLDLPDREIADLLGVTPSTVRATVSRALGDLRTSMSAHPSTGATR